MTNNNDSTWKLEVSARLSKNIPIIESCWLELKVLRTNYSRLVIHFLVNANAPRGLRECSFLKLLLVPLRSASRLIDAAQRKTGGISADYLQSCE